MPNRYNIKYQGVALAMAHVLPHPQYEGQVMISVIPVQKKNDERGKLDRALYGNFPDTKPDIEAIGDLISKTGFETEKIEINKAGR